jgi:hypothetical protein
VSSAVRQAGSFRDPAGFLFEREGVLYRQVNRSFAEEFDAFESSGLMQGLQAEGLLVEHEDAPLELAATDDAHRVLRPRRIPFVSYPYEWSPSQLRDAALATLRAQRLALDAGMSLRDASAYNVQHAWGRPVLIDLLSFARVPEGRPWVAYGQFCRHFLAPLALMRYRDPRLGRLLQVHLDGIPLDLAASLVPRRAAARGSLLLHLFAHAKSEGRARAGGGSSPERRGAFSMRAFQGLLDSLESAVRGLVVEPSQTEWTSYDTACRTYTAEAATDKERLVGEYLDAAAPGTVWDLGANVGRFSRLAAARGAFTLSVDLDPSVVELNYVRARTEGEGNLLPLVMDLANPSPAIGWANRERMTLDERGPADLVMALALVHHLAIGNNVPLDDLAGFFAGLAPWLIIEFVPKEDPMVGEMLSRREDVFPGYTLAGFEAAFGRRNEIVRRYPILGSARTLFLMRST